MILKKILKIQWKIDSSSLMSENKYYTIDEVADLLRVGNAFIYRVIFTGKLKASNNIISKDNINNYLDKHGEYLERVRGGTCLRM